MYGMTSFLDLSIPHLKKATCVLRHRFKLNCLKNCFHHVLAPNAIQITRIKFAQWLLVVQRLLIQNNPERPFVKMLKFISISSPTKVPNMRAITKIWNNKGLVKFTFHICQYYFSKTGKYINLIVDLCTNALFYWNISIIHCITERVVCIP